jgi:prepilin-type N-terminal cleavage/methylation domain-containing protein
MTRQTEILMKDCNILMLHRQGIKKRVMMSNTTVQPAKVRLRGFTLVELLIALSIIVSLLAMISAIYQVPISRAERSVLKANLRVIRRALQEFYNDQGRYPYNGQDRYGNMVTFLDNNTSELVMGVHSDLGKYSPKRVRYIVSIPPDPTLTDPTPLWKLIPFDNDSDWDIHTDDVGADHIANTGDPGEGDGVPSAGEPHVDEDPFGNDDEDVPPDGRVDEDPPDVRNVFSTNIQFGNL